MSLDSPASFVPLITARAADISTFRYSGALEPTLLGLLVLDGQHALIETLVPISQHHRLALFREVLVTPCTSTGRQIGPAIPAVAHQIRNRQRSQSYRMELPRHRIRSWIDTLRYRLRGLEPVYYELVPNVASQGSITTGAFHGLR